MCCCFLDLTSPRLVCDSVSTLDRAVGYLDGCFLVRYILASIMVSPLPPLARRFSEFIRGQADIRMTRQFFENYDEISKAAQKKNQGR